MSEQVTEPAPTAGIALRDYVDRLLLQVLAALPAGWGALRDATLPGPAGGPPERLGLLLVHPRVGVAVLDLMPGPTTEDAPLRLGRVLEASGWSAEFGALPPIIHLCVPLRALRGIETWLEQTFGEQPPLALRRDDWVAALQRLLGATPLLRSDLARGGLPGRPARPRRTAAGRSIVSTPGLRGLFWFWGGLALVAVSGAALLQFLGPPDEAAPGEGPKLASAPPPPPLAAPALPPLLLPVLPAAEAPTAGEAPQLDRRDPPPAETRMVTVPMPDKALRDGRLAAAARPPTKAAAPPPAQPHAAAPGLPGAEPASSLTEAASSDLAGSAAAIPDILPLPYVLPSAEPDGVFPSAALPFVAAPPVPLPHPASPPPVAGIAPLGPPALVEAAMPPVQPSPEPPPAAGSAAAPAYSRPEDEPPDSLPPVASGGGAVVAAESAPGKDGAGPKEVPATPADAALPAAEGSSPAGDPPFAPPAPIAGVAGAAAGPTPGEGGGRDAPAMPAAEAEPPAPSEPVAAAMAGPVAGEASVPASQETEPAVSPGFARPSAAVPVPSATSTASSKPRGREPALPVPPRPQGGSGPPEARPVKPATSGQPDERGAAASSQAALPVPDTAARPGFAVPGPAAPQGRASVPPGAAALPPGPPAGTPPAPQLTAILRRGDVMLAVGDVSAARLLYARAAAAGSGEAMLALGKVQDPLFLEEIGARGALGDAALAIGWYRRAQALGVPEARDRLVRHGVRPEE